MRSELKLILGRLLLFVFSLMPLVVAADTNSTVGAVGAVDSKLPLLDANTQKNMRANNTLGTSEAKARAQSNCGDKFDKSIDQAAKNVATAAAPGDPLKRFNDAIGSCLENIQTISMALSFPTLSITGALEAILNKVIDKLINDVLMKICAAATGTWNNAINNAVNTVNTGINQSGINTFGSFVSVSQTPVSPAPLAPAPPAPAPAPFKSNSAIPGL